MTATPLSIVLSVMGLFVEVRKRWAIIALCIGGAMALLIGVGFLLAVMC